MKWNHALLITSYFFCATALAQAPEAKNDRSPMAQLTPQMVNGYTYLCGGIGSGEAAQMKRDAAQYSLMITFAENSGVYLADIGVEIGAANGPAVLKTTCGGPIMLVNFPSPGSYRIHAKVAEQEQSKTVSIRSGVKGTRLEMVWPHRAPEAPAPN